MENNQENKRPKRKRIIRPYENDYGKGGNELRDRKDVACEEGAHRKDQAHPDNGGRERYLNRINRTDRQKGERNYNRIDRPQQEGQRHSYTKGQYGNPDQRGYTERKPYRNDGERRQYSDQPDRERRQEWRNDDRREGRYVPGAGERKGNFNREGTRNREYRPARREGEQNFNRVDRTHGNRNEYYGERIPARGGFRDTISNEEKETLRQKHYSKKKILQHRLKNENEDTELRLNRYISMSGICSRRDADELITSGRVKVNGELVQSVGVKVHKKDCIEVDGERIMPERKVYLVLNKPRNCVTTVEDPLERKTVMDLIEGACKERVFPVGRLDRNTTGVLLFTNDGDLAKKLTHPKYDRKKIYHVFVDKPVTKQDMETIATGVELEDGFIRADEISYASDDKTQIGIEIHSGKNRIVRRIFEHLGYQIVKLDRVYFAGITKKRLPRGKWRFLTPQEANMLKYY